jgi:hypothetical protein
MPRHREKEQKHPAIGTVKGEGRGKGKGRGKGRSKGRSRGKGREGKRRGPGLNAREEDIDEESMQEWEAEMLAKLDDDESQREWEATMISKASGEDEQLQWDKKMRDKPELAVKTDDTGGKRGGQISNESTGLALAKLLSPDGSKTADNRENSNTVGNPLSPESSHNANVAFYPEPDRDNVFYPERKHSRGNENQNAAKDNAKAKEEMSDDLAKAKKEKTTKRKGKAEKEKANTKAELAKKAKKAKEERKEKAKEERKVKAKEEQPEKETSEDLAALEEGVAGSELKKKPRSSLLSCCWRVLIFSWMQYLFVLGLMFARLRRSNRGLDKLVVAASRFAFFWDMFSDVWLCIELHEEGHWNYLYASLGAIVLPYIVCVMGLGVFTYYRVTDRDNGASMSQRIYWVLEYAVLGLPKLLLRDARLLTVDIFNR